MNVRYVIRQFALLLLVLSGAVLVMAAYEMWIRLAGSADAYVAEVEAIFALLLTFGTGVALSVALLGVTRGAEVMLGRREALLLVAIAWLFGAAYAALPYLFWAHIHGDWTHPFASYVACYFEAMSGLTTTGASVLTDIEALPRGLLLWRSTTHWLGGLGIVVMFVAVLPSLGVGGKKLFQVEAPGPTAPGVRPKIRETARVLWFIYLALTAAEIIALRLLGMNWFDAVNHTFATLATGGFSTRNASLGAYNSAAIDAIVIVFMILAGVNFGLYYHLMRGRVRLIWQDAELRLYLLIILIATVIVFAGIVFRPIVTTTGETIEPGVLNALRYSLFQTVSIQTTTGFATADFNVWMFAPKIVLVLLMFIGASAGSTGGGIKVVRILIAIRVIGAEIGRIFQPNVVQTVRIGRTVIDAELRQATLAYFMIVIGFWVLGTTAIMLIEGERVIDFASAATASAATLNNIGPGLGLVGAVENYGWFGSPSLAVMSLLMVLGRLEVYAVLVLFMPSFWKRD